VTMSDHMPIPCYGRHAVRQSLLPCWDKRGHGSLRSRAPSRSRATCTSTSSVSSSARIGSSLAA
jgi:hypothetical protein